MEEDQDLKFVCKLCNKKYPCGKSLGGHMRSHVLSNSSEFDEKIESNKLKKMESWTNISSGISSSYGLRENPKKTWRAEDSNQCYSYSLKIMMMPSDTHNQSLSNIDSKYSSPLSHEKVCQQCGKVFQSMKALCGHMACHSEKDKGGLKDDDDDDEDDDDEDDDNSWTSDHNSHSDTEDDELINQRYRSSTIKRYNNNSIVVKSSNNFNRSSCVSEIDYHEQEQEEVAKCLMMLSRDSWISNGHVNNSLIETSDNNSVVLETKSSSTTDDILRNHARKKGLKRVYNEEYEKPRYENSDSDYYLGENGNVESDGSVEGFLGNNGKCKWSTSKKSLGDWLDECRTDDKKGINRIKRYLTESRKDLSKKFERDGHDLSRKRSTTDRYNHQEIRNDSKKMKFGDKSSLEGCKKYECLNCKKIFSSYQALGGHRPCHKKMNNYSESTYKSGENSHRVDHNDPQNTKIDKHKDVFRHKKAGNPAQDMPYEPEKKVKPKKPKGHKCPFCHRVFKSGQALGGHKRSHFIHGGDQENLNQQSSSVKREVADLLDLNLPAPVDEEDDEHARFMSW